MINETYLDKENKTKNGIRYRVAALLSDTKLKNEF